MAPQQQGNESVVVVTGFGPFRDHLVNASWECVKLLPQLNNVRLVTAEIAVSYREVEHQVKQLWEVYKPKLVVHVGVSSLIHKMTIETVANRSGYLMTDCEGKLHPTGHCCQEGDEVIRCAIDAERICQQINESGDLQTCTSRNAGRYLCEYIFYKSLNVDRGKSMFVHVPPLEKPYSAEQLARGLSRIIELAINQIDGTECTIKHV